jgi:hypothetical protein
MIKAKTAETVGYERQLLSLKPSPFYFSNTRLVSQCIIFHVTRLSEYVKVRVGLSLI